MATITGTSGNNILFGSSSADTINGLGGNDTINGGGGGDTIAGGGGTDRLTGGTGADVFVFNEGDSPTTRTEHVTDFQVGVDRAQFNAGAWNTTDTADGTWISYGNNQRVLFDGVHATLEQLQNPGGGTSPPPPPPPDPGGGGTSPPPPDSGGGGTSPPPPGSGGWVESFDGGLGRLSHHWGDVDTSVPGQVTLTTHASTQWTDKAGIMMFPSGPEAGEGYGTYRFVLNTHGGSIGDYALLWPGAERPPGQEIDVIELNQQGQPYSVVHWQEPDGSIPGNYYSQTPADMTATHEYVLRWEPGRLTMWRDGAQQWTTTERVPVDYAHGGMDEIPGVGLDAYWAPGYQNGDNTLTVYEVSYSPLG